MNTNLRKYYEQLVAIRDGLEELWETHEWEDEEDECLESCIDGLGAAIDNLEIVVGGDNGVSITIELG